jgi:predicted RNase H-like HicB family nuclease
MLLEYVQAAMRSATYEKLPDGTYCGRIPKCPGTIAFARNLFDCQEELRSVLEDWLIVKIRHGDPVPVIGAINLNRRQSLRPALAARG